MRYGLLIALVVGLTGCIGPLRQPSTVQGSRDTVRLQLPPDRAAACFARNAEEHSSALIAEVRPGGDSAEVIVRVKNGVLYGTADFRRAGGGSTAYINLNVTTTGSRRDLVAALTAGC